MALVNLKPLLPGHVLVCPRRVVPRLRDLTVPETTDLFQTVSMLSKHLEKIYKADSFNVAIQDGPAAGQSVPHVHAHIIPRKYKDLGEGPEAEDKIYAMMESDDADLWRAFRQKEGRFPVPDCERKPRTDLEMKEEADWLRTRIKELEEAAQREGSDKEKL